ncbi:MAG: hypothetical protein ACLUE2_02710 [Bacteroides cellulosilyticus]
MQTGIQITSRVTYARNVLTTHPSFRDKAENMRELQRIGYNADPGRRRTQAKVDALTFDDIVKFYEENIKGKPLLHRKSR